MTVQSAPNYHKKFTSASLTILHIIIIYKLVTVNNIFILNNNINYYGGAFESHKQTGIFFPKVTSR